MGLNLFAASVAVLVAGGCASNADTGESSPPPSQAVVITTEPASVVVPIGRSATFTVQAAGTPPLTYQWNENGVDIAGATNASFTTPLVSLDDSGSAYQVSVKNATSSAASAVATLTAGARAPAIGDVRYLLWDQFPSVPTSGANIDIGMGIEQSDTNALGTPLPLGVANEGCVWEGNILFFPQAGSGFSMYYVYDGNFGYQSYQSFLQSLVASNIVITSMDLVPVCGEFGVSYVQVAQGGFDPRVEIVSPADVQSTVAQDGSESRIVTAATFDHAAGEVVMMSYGWQGDTATTYDAETSIVTASDIVNTVNSLASQGFFLSAFGGNDTDGFVLVGMRVHGDTLPRNVSTDSSGTSPDSGDSTVVARYYEPTYSQMIQEQ